MARIATGLEALQNFRLIALREERWFFLTRVFSGGGPATFATSSVLPEGSVILEIRIHGVNATPGTQTFFSVGVWLVTPEELNDAIVADAEKVIDWGAPGTPFTFRGFGLQPDQRFFLSRVVKGGNLRLGVGAVAFGGTDDTVAIGIRYKIP